MLDAFQNQGDSLAHTDAHGAQRIFSLCAHKLVERGGYKPCSAGTEGVSYGDRTAVWIYVRRVVWNSQFAQDGQRLRGEGFVQFDDVHLPERQTRFGQNLVRRGSWTHAHDSRSYASGCGGDDSGSWRQSVALQGCFRG